MVGKTVVRPGRLLKAVSGHNLQLAKIIYENFAEKKRIIIAVNYVDIKC